MMRVFCSLWQDWLLSDRMCHLVGQESDMDSMESACAELAISIGILDPSDTRTHESIAWT
jgi:hypothetical protein